MAWRRGIPPSVAEQLQLDRETKDRLCAAGLWEWFQKRAVDLEGDGLTSANAQRKALSEALRGAEQGSGTKASRAKRRAVRKPARKGASSESVLELLQSAPEGLVGRVAAEPDIVRWVARSIDHPDPDPDGCPDPFAWTLLRMCRESLEFRVWFVEKLWVKLIPARSHVDQAKPAGFDGKPTIELIERIQAMRDEAMAS